MVCFHFLDSCEALLLPFLVMTGIKSAFSWLPFELYLVFLCGVLTREVFFVSFASPVMCIPSV